MEDLVAEAREESAAAGFALHPGRGLVTGAEMGGRHMMFLASAPQLDKRIGVVSRVAKRMVG